MQCGFQKIHNQWFFYIDHNNQRLILEDYMLPELKRQIENALEVKR